MNSRGFTLIELVAVLAILGVLAGLTLPLAEISVQRGREQELRRSLREIRDAIDGYKRAADEGRIILANGSTGYPPSLQALVEGVVDAKDARRRKLYFLRRLPRDPMHADGDLDAAATWGKRSYASDADAPRAGDDVYDVHSQSTVVGLNGIEYRKW